jgi:hypothetical protein
MLVATLLSRRDRAAVGSVPAARDVHAAGEAMSSSDETSHLEMQLARLGSAIDKELGLINERMSWLVISESFIFSAFTTAIVSVERSRVLAVFTWLMPIVGLLLVLLVYPALLAAHHTANGLKAERGRFEAMLPEALRLQLLATKRDHFFGSVPTFAVPAMLIVVWMVVFVVMGGHYR